MNQARFSLDEMNAMDRVRFIEVFGGVFEHSPWVAEESCSLRPFASLSKLHKAMNSVVAAAAESRQLALIRAHPDLAGRLAKQGLLTAESSREQAAAGLGTLSPEEEEVLQNLNERYRARFGFPFIICARLNQKETILEQLTLRIENTPEAEKKNALREINQITLHRLRDLLRTGKLTSHVLDTSRGRPAAGVLIQLWEMQAGGTRLLAEANTNSDGRTDEPLLSGDDFATGEYELRFDVRAYFGDDSSLLRIVPVRFYISEIAGHYHIPLLVTPWSYTTYRGS